MSKYRGIARCSWHDGTPCSAPHEIIPEEYIRGANSTQGLVFFWAPFVEGPALSRGCPLSWLTPKQREGGPRADHLPWDRHRAGHFLATLIRRVANMSGNFIRTPGTHLSTIIGRRGQPLRLSTRYFPTHSFPAMILKYDFKSPEMILGLAGYRGSGRHGDRECFVRIALTVYRLDSNCSVVWCTKFECYNGYSSAA